MKNYVYIEKNIVYVGSDATHSLRHPWGGEVGTCPWWIRADCCSRNERSYKDEKLNSEILTTYAMVKFLENHNLPKLTQTKKA